MRSYTLFSVAESIRSSASNESTYLGVAGKLWSAGYEVSLEVLSVLWDIRPFSQGTRARFYSAPMLDTHPLEPPGRLWTQETLDMTNAALQRSFKETFGTEEEINSPSLILRCQSLLRRVTTTMKKTVEQLVLDVPPTSGQSALKEPTALPFRDLRVYYLNVVIFVKFFYKALKKAGITPFSPDDESTSCIITEEILRVVPVVIGAVLKVRKG